MIDDESLPSLEQKTGALARYIFRSPHWAPSLLAALLFSALIGGAAFDSGFLVDVGLGLGVWGVPAVIGAIVTPVLVRLFDGSISFKASSLLSLVTVILMAVVVSAASAIARLTKLGWVTPDGIMMALAVGMAIRTLSLLAISNDDMWMSIPPALVQPLLTLLLLVPVYPPVGENTIYYVNLGVATLIYLVATHLFLTYIDAPLQKTLGVSGLEFIRCLIAHFNEGSREIEEFFHKIGERVNLPVTTFAFHSGENIKAVFVVPSIHPGPLGEVGGGSLPEILQREIGGEVFAFHGFADHDFNPVSQQEIDKVVAAVQESLDSVDYRWVASQSTTIREDSVRVVGQRFNDSVFLGVTQSPNPGEDIDFGVGLTAAAEARARGARCAGMVDAHNCSNNHAPNILQGSKTSFDIIDASAECTESLMAVSEGRVLLGVAHREPMWTREEGMGDTGVKVAVVEVLGQQTAYVLIDGNNMVQGLREQILEHLDVDEAEVYTTDSHVVNMRRSHNYVGKHIPPDDLIEIIVELVEEAKDDLEVVEVGAHTSIAQGVFVFGSRRTSQLAATANSIVSMGWALAAAIVIASLSLSVLAFLLI